MICIILGQFLKGSCPGVVFLIPIQGIGILTGNIITVLIQLQRQVFRTHSRIVAIVPLLGDLQIHHDQGVGSNCSIHCAVVIANVISVVENAVRYLTGLGIDLQGVVIVALTCGGMRGHLLQLCRRRIVFIAATNRQNIVLAVGLLNLFCDLILAGAVRAVHIEVNLPAFGSGAVNILVVLLPLLGDRQICNQRLILDVAAVQLRNIGIIRTRAIADRILTLIGIVTIGQLYIIDMGFQYTILQKFDRTVDLSSLGQTGKFGCPLIAVCEISDEISGTKDGIHLILAHNASKHVLGIIPCVTAIAGHLQFHRHGRQLDLIADILPYLLGRGRGENVILKICVIDTIGGTGLAASAIGGIIAFGHSFFEEVAPLLTILCVTIQMLDRKGPDFAIHGHRTLHLIIQDLVGVVDIGCVGGNCYGLGIAVQNNRSHFLLCNAVGLAVQSQCQGFGTSAERIILIIPGLGTGGMDLRQCGIVITHIHMGRCIAVHTRTDKAVGIQDKAIAIPEFLRILGNRPTIHTTLSRSRQCGSIITQCHSGIVGFFLIIVTGDHFFRDEVDIGVTIGSIDQLIAKVLECICLGFFRCQRNRLNQFCFRISVVIVYLIEAVQAEIHTIGETEVCAHFLSSIVECLLNCDGAGVGLGDIKGVDDVVAIDRVGQLFVCHIDGAALSVGNDLDDGVLVHLTILVILGKGCAVEVFIRDFGDFLPQLQCGHNLTGFILKGNSINLSCILGNQLALACIDAHIVHLEAIVPIRALVIHNGCHADIAGTAALGTGLIPVQVEAQQRQVFQGESIRNLLPNLMANNRGVILQLNDKGIVGCHHIVRLTVFISKVSNDRAVTGIGDIIGRIVYGSLVVCSIIIIVIAGFALTHRELGIDVVQNLTVYVGIDRCVIGDLSAVSVILRQVIEGIAPPVLSIFVIALTGPLVFLKRTATVRYDSGDPFIVLILIPLGLVQSQEHVRTLLVMNTVLIQPQQVKGHVCGVLEGIGDRNLANNIAIRINAIGHCAGRNLIGTLLIGVSIGIVLNCFFHIVMQDLAVLIVQRQVVECNGGNIFLSIDLLGTGNSIAIFIQDRQFTLSINYVADLDVTLALLFRNTAIVFCAVHRQGCVVQLTVYLAIVLPSLGHNQIGDTDTQVGDSVEVVAIHLVGAGSGICIIIVDNGIGGRRIALFAIGNCGVAALIGLIGSIHSYIAHTDLSHVVTTVVESVFTVLDRLFLTQSSRHLNFADEFFILNIGRHVHAGMHPLHSLIEGDGICIDEAFLTVFSTIQKHTAGSIDVELNLTAVGGGTVVQPDLSHVNLLRNTDGVIVELDRVCFQRGIVVHIQTVVGECSVLILVFGHDVGDTVAVFIILGQIDKGLDPLTALIHNTVYGIERAGIILSIDFQRIGVATRAIVVSNHTVLINLVNDHIDICRSQRAVPVLSDPVFSGTHQFVGDSSMTVFDFFLYHKALCAGFAVAVGIHSVRIQLQLERIVADGFSDAILVNGGLFPPVGQFVTFAVIVVNSGVNRRSVIDRVKTANAFGFHNKGFISFRIIILTRSCMLCIKGQFHFQLIQRILVVSCYPFLSNRQILRFSTAVGDGAVVINGIIASLTRIIAIPNREGICNGLVTVLIYRNLAVDLLITGIAGQIFTDKVDIAVTIGVILLKDLRQFNGSIYQRDILMFNGFQDLTVGIQSHRDLLHSRGSKVTAVFGIAPQGIGSLGTLLIAVILPLLGESKVRQACQGKDQVAIFVSTLGVRTTAGNQSIIILNTVPVAIVQRHDRSLYRVERVFDLLLVRIIQRQHHTVGSSLIILS